MEWNPSNDFPDEFNKIVNIVYKDDPFYIPESSEQVVLSFKRLKMEGYKKHIALDGGG